MTSRTRMGFLVALLALAGCDGGNSNPDGGPGPDSGPTPDAGPTPDGGPLPDGGPPPDTCGSARAVTLTMGEQTLTGDTTGRSSGLTLSEGCGNAASPQEVLALTLPGSGPMAVSFDLLNDATMFDTLVEVRTVGCASIEGAECFDDTGFDTRSSGVVLAEGGSTLHFIVTGYDGAASGPWQMLLDVGSANPPVLTGVEALRVGETRYELLVDGSDPDGDAAGIFVSFLDAAGETIFFDGEEEFGIEFEESQAGNTTLTDALARLTSRDFVAGTSEATQVRVQLVDEVGQASEAMTFAIRNVAEVGVDGTCNADSFCFLGLECDAGACRIPPATVTACEAPTALNVTADAPTMASGTLTPGGASLFVGSCGITTGPEVVYGVTIGSAGLFDLIVSTDNAASGEADTVVYVQTTCGDPTTERACNDDEGEAYLSTAIVSEVSGDQTYTVVVEHYGEPPAATPFQLDLRLRPVLEGGVACDPTGEANRCRLGACPTGVEGPVCPSGL